jgi:hypothetical protein
MEELYILKNIIVKTENRIKLMKIDEFNKVWLQDLDDYNIFMRQLVCSFVKYNSYQNNIECQVKFNYLLQNTVLVEIKSIDNESHSVNVYINNILEFEQYTSLDIETNRYFSNYGNWELSFQEINDMIIKVLHIVTNNKLIQG